MSDLLVSLGDRSYPIKIGPGLMQSTELSPFVQGKQAMVITNETVAPLYLNAFLTRLDEEDIQADSLVLSDGEQFKTLESVQRIFDALIEKRHNRTTTLFALGGGVIGDMTGFAAACYQRGVAFIQIPTTLLAQVDSSVGGKTAVNHPCGKNMIGAFYQPKAVIIDTNSLNTLPEREFSAGLAEVIKYGLIADMGFFSWLEQNMDALRRRDPNAVTEAVSVSCRVKAKVVAADETEQGQRAILNLGHTFGHAIEAAQNYRQWLHGEAVGAGMVMAAEFSARLGWIQPADVTRARNLIAAAGLPIWAPENIGTTQFLELMGIDKKVIDGRIRLVLLQSMGRACVTSEFPLQELKSLIDG